MDSQVGSLEILKILNLTILEAYTFLFILSIEVRSKEKL